MKSSSTDIVWIDVGTELDFKLNSLTPVRVAGQRLIIVNSSAGIQCFVDECTHQPIPLSDFGEVLDGRLICHAHGGQFDLECRGKALCFPLSQDLKSFNVKIERSRVLVEL
jgi:naphthalene 1,2-dioxygenase ferredoxin component